MSAEEKDTENNTVDIEKTDFKIERCTCFYDVIFNFNWTEYSNVIMYCVRTLHRFGSK